VARVCWICCFLPCSEGFSSGSPVCLSLQNQLSKFQFDFETADEKSLNRMCYCKFLFIYLFIYFIIHFIINSCHSDSNSFHVFKVRSAIVMWKRRRQRTSYASGKETTQQKVFTLDNALQLIQLCGTSTTDKILVNGWTKVVWYWINCKSLPVFSSSIACFRLHRLKKSSATVDITSENTEIGTSTLTWWSATKENLLFHDLKTSSVLL